MSELRNVSFEVAYLVLKNKACLTVFKINNTGQLKLSALLREPFSLWIRAAFVCLRLEKCAQILEI